MQTLPYTIIKSDTQYYKYCDKLEKLVDSRTNNKAIQDEIELLTLLIEKYDEQHNTFTNADPVELIKSLMKNHQMKSIGLARLLNVSEGLVSDILHYRKGLSKNVIRKLSEHFKLSQEAFNRPYRLLKQHAVHHTQNSNKKRVRTKARTAA